MRRCDDLVRLLADFLDGRLPPEVHASLEAHLAACPDCLAQLHTYRSTIDLLHSVTEEDLPPDLRLTLKSFVEEHWGN
jgi:anti-sigma factor (TIGR02949 family)